MFRYNQKGSALAFTLIIMMVMAILGGVILNTSIAETKFAKIIDNKQQAYYIARSGAETMASWISRPGLDKSVVFDIMDSNQTNSRNTTIPTVVDGHFTIRFPQTSPDVFTPIIESEGSYKESTQTVRLALTKRFFFESAVTATSRLSIDNNNVLVDGDVALASGAVLDLKNNVSQDTVITGTVSATTRTYPEPQRPSLGPGSWPSDNTILYNDEDHADKAYGSVDLISGELNIVLDGDMDLVFDSLQGNNATINVTGKGNLNIYVDDFMFMGDLYTSSTAKTTVNVFSTGSVEFKTGQSTFQGFIYGPGADIVIKANAEVNGGFVVASTLTLGSGAKLIYHSTYGNVYPEDLNFPSEGYDKLMYLDE